MPTIPVYVGLPNFYAVEVGLGLTAIGVALMAARLLDVVTDPIVGLICDAYPTRLGRRKPWIALGAVLAGASLFQLFVPPTGAGAVYLLAWAAMLYLGWTLVAIPYAAWGAEMFGDYNARSRVAGIREAASLLGILIAGCILAIGPQMEWPNRLTQVGVAVATLIVGAPTLALLLWRVPERTTVTSNRILGEPPTKLLHNLHRNRPFLRLVFAWLLNGLANGLAAALFPLYLRHGLRVDEAIQGLLLFAYFSAGIAAIPGWLWVSRQLGKHRTWCCAMALAIIVFLSVPAIDAGQWPFFLLVCILTGASLGADLTLPPALQADVVDYDAWKFGRPRAGVLFALWGMATKFALALSVGIALPLLDAFGFMADANQNHPDAVLALVVIYALGPAVLKSLSVALVWHYPLTGRVHLAIRRRLDRAA